MKVLAEAPQRDVAAFHVAAGLCRDLINRIRLARGKCQSCGRQMSGRTELAMHQPDCLFRLLEEQLRPVGVLGAVVTRYPLEARCGICDLLLGASVEIRQRNEIAFHWDEWLVHFMVLHPDSKKAAVKVDIRKKLETNEGRISRDPKAIKRPLSAKTDFKGRRHRS
jgi:hypothetical protein